MFTLNSTPDMKVNLFFDLYLTFILPSHRILALSFLNFQHDFQKALVMCTKGNEFECLNEDGFTCKQTHPRHAEITIPESFAPESGYFRCVMPGVPKPNVTRCHWPPSDSGRPDDLRNPYSTFASPLTNETSYTAPVETATEGSASAASAGVIIGTLIPAVLILAAIIVIWVIVRRKCTKRPGSLKTCPLEDCVSNAEDFRKRLCSRLEPTQNECEAERGNLRRDRKTKSSGPESPLLISDSGNPKTSSDGMPDIEGDKAKRSPSVQFTENDTWEREKNNKIS